MRFYAGFAQEVPDIPFRNEKWLLPGSIMQLTFGPFNKMSNPNAPNSWEI